MPESDKGSYVRGGKEGVMRSHGWREERKNGRIEGTIGYGEEQNN